MKDQREEEEEKSAFSNSKIDVYVFLIASLCKNTFLVLVPLLNLVGTSCHISMCHTGVR